MSDFRQQVREHYDAQSLSPEKVEAILAKGRAAMEGGEENTVPFPAKKSWSRFIPAIAAAIVLVISGVWWLNRPVSKVSYAAIMPEVIEFFDKKSELLPAPQEKQALHEMLVSKGAPKEFEIPPTLMSLESAACQVVDVKGEKAYLSCYWRETDAHRDNHDMIHLLVARAGDFMDKPPAHGSPPRTREMNGWSFASWSHGDIIYMLAAEAPLEKVTPYLSAIERAADRTYPHQENGLDKMEVAGLRSRFSDDAEQQPGLPAKRYPRGERVLAVPVPERTASAPACDCIQTASSGSSGF